MPTTVTIRWSSEWQEFRVVPVGLTGQAREDQTYFAEDYDDAVFTAQRIAGPGGAILDRTRCEGFILRAIVDETPGVGFHTTGWGVCYRRRKDGSLHVHTTYQAHESALAVADVTRLNGVCP